MDDLRYICRVERLDARAAQYLLYDRHCGEVLQSDLEPWMDCCAAGLAQLRTSYIRTDGVRLQTVQLTARLRTSFDPSRPQIYRLTSVSGRRYLVSSGQLGLIATLSDSEGRCRCGEHCAPLPVSSVADDSSASASGDALPQLNVTLTAVRGLWLCL